MSLVREQAAFLSDVCKLIGFAASRGFVLTGGELERKPEMQEIYVKTGRSKTMDSMHLRKCAIDLNFFVERDGRLELIYDIGLLQPIGDYWESLNPRNRWGGNWRTFKDLPHFERNLKEAARSEAPGVKARPEPSAAKAPESAAAATEPAPGEARSDAHAGLMATVRRGSGNDRMVLVLQSGLQRLGYLDTIDGKFGPDTEAAVRRFQKEKGLVVDGVVGDKTWTTLFALTPQAFGDMAAKWITQKDLDRAAEELQVDGATVKAVYEVESGGTGFVGTRPKILFEGHVFWERLEARGIAPETHRAGNEDILYPQWTRRHYLGGLREYDRLDRARRIHEESALEATSWGLFQIMGHHCKRLGYGSVADFVKDMGSSEGAHLRAFCAFVQKTKSQGKLLVDYLRERDWAGFAYGYNGEGYRANRYDEKLEAAYNRARATLA